jgi:bacillithiol system protein YtxJ
MGLFGSTKNTFPWVKLTTIEQLDELFDQSAVTPVLLFKHSTTCGISSMVLTRFESKWDADPSKCICVYLDLKAYRSVSNAIAEKTGIRHESPQAILLKNRTAVYNASHGMIDTATIKSHL